MYCVSEEWCRNKCIKHNWDPAGFATKGRAPATAEKIALSCTLHATRFLLPLGFQAKRFLLPLRFDTKRFLLPLAVPC